MFAEFAAHLRQLTLDQASVMRQRLSGRRRADAAPPALQQLHAAIGFHIAQPLAGSRQ